MKCMDLWKDRRRNVDVLKEMSIEKDIVDLLQVRRLTYFGHVNRMGNDRFPNTAWLKTWTAAERKTRKEMARQYP